MNWSDVSKAIGAAAPTIGVLLGGPAGGAVGSLVAAALGADNTPEAVNAIIAKDPAALAKIQELQINAKVQLQQLVVQAEQNRLQAEAAQYTAEAADRDSARKLAASQPNDIVRPILTLVVLAGALFIITALVMGWATEVIKDPTAAVTVGTVFGVWLSLTKEVIGFWFGMTKDAQKQTAAITDFAVAPGTVTRPNK